MAATNISTKIKERASNARYEQPYETRVYTFDVTDAEFDGIETVATHNIAPIEEGYALIGGCGIVSTAVTSAGSATLKFQVGSDALTGAIPKANLAAGDVFRLLFAESASTESKALYAASAADTLDMVVGTAALTAGKITLVLHYVDMTTVLASGKIKP